MRAEPPRERLPRERRPGLTGFAAAALGMISLGLTLCGCSGATQDAPTQQWRDLQVHVETRSYGPIPGMKELLVIINRNGVLPAWDCRVDLRTSDADPWKQAIEDGHVGVYRRALVVDQGEHSVLQVRISAEGNETVLHIPI
jgi:hypothetical protein